MGDSVTRDRSSWGFTIKHSGRTVHEDSGAPRVTTSSLTMEVEAVTWNTVASLPVWRTDYTCHHSHRFKRWSLEWAALTGTQSCAIFGCTLLWIYRPGHAGISGNEHADRLASTADFTAGLQLGRVEVLRGLRNFLNLDRLEHHSIDCLKERGVEKGSSRHSTLWGREQSVFNQTNIGTVLSGVARVFLSAKMPPWAETETELKLSEGQLYN